MKTNGVISNNIDERFQHSAPVQEMLEKAAILQRDGTYAIAPHTPGGMIDPELLIKIAGVSQKYNCRIKLTSSQRIAIIGLKQDDIEAAWRELGVEPKAAYGLCVRSVKFCPGTTFCKRGQQDAVGLGMEIDRRYYGMALPSKFKIDVSGCPNKCMDTMLIDFGVMGTPKGFTLFVGGNGGMNPRFGEKLAEHQTGDQVLDILDRTFDYYKKEARTNERLGRFIDRVGFDQYRQVVLKQKTVH